MAQPTLGIYRLITQLNSDYVIDVYGASAETDAKVTLYGNNDTSAQKFMLTKGYSDNNSYRRMIFQCSGRAAYVPKGENPGDNSIVRQYPPSEGTDDLDWSFAQDTTKSMTINGVVYHPYEITYRYKNTLRLDNSCGRVAASNDIVVYTDNNTNAQRWVLVKDSFINTSWEIPRMSISSSIIAKNAIENKTLKLSGGSAYQTRYRYRTINHNTNSWTSWSNWKSMSDTITDEGWGDAWNSNSTASNTVSLQAANSSPTLSSTAHDSVNYQFESRKFGSFTPSHWGSDKIAHSDSNTLNIITRQLLEGQINSIALSAMGLVVDLQTNAYRTYEKAKLIISIKQGTSTIINNWTKTNVSATGGSFAIPYDELEKIPLAGSTVSVSYKFAPVSNYLTTITKTQSLTVGTEGGTLKPKLNFTYFNEYDAKVKITEETGKTFTSTELSLVYKHGGKFVVKPLKNIGSNTYEVAFPINTRATLFASMFKKSGETIQDWGTKEHTHTYSERVMLGCVINSKELEYTFPGSLEKWPVGEVSDNFNRNDAEINGYQYQKVNYKDSINSSFAIKDVIFLASDRTEVEHVINSGHILVRDTRGQYINAAVDNAQWGIVSLEYEKVTLNCTQVSNDVDIAMPY